MGDPESSGVALLRRAAPGPWRLLFDPEGGTSITMDTLAITMATLANTWLRLLLLWYASGTSYELLEEAKERPSPEQMEALGGHRTPTLT